MPDSFIAFRLDSFSNFVGFVQTLLDEVEEMSTQLLLLCKSITTAMSTCSERIADIGSEVDVLLESALRSD
jgi:hypothetical protein